MVGPYLPLISDVHKSHMGIVYVMSQLKP